MSREYKVYTWQELTEQLSSQSDAYDEYPIYITLMADIDMNEVAPSGVGTTPVYTNTYQYTKVLNMNGHSIKNLRTNIANPQPIFTDDNLYNNGASFMIINGDFVNLICAGSHFISFHNQSNSNITLQNVRFVGYRTGNSYLLNKEDRITCTSCYFDMPWYGAGSSTYDYTSLVKRGTPTTNIPTANYCWFHETYGGWTITNSESTGGVCPPQEYPVTQCSMFAMNGCYIDGTMKNGMYHWGSSGNGEIYIYVYRKEIGENYTASTPNVIDMHWYSDLNYRYVTVKVLNMNAVFKKSFNAGQYEANAYQRVTTGSQPNIILGTAQEMQDVNWLRAQGFPIIEDTPSE